MGPPGIDYGDVEHIMGPRGMRAGCRAQGMGRGIAQKHIMDFLSKKEKYTLGKQAPPGVRAYLNSKGPCFTQLPRVLLNLN